jgi:hypothetical protein
MSEAGMEGPYPPPNPVGAIRSHTLVRFVDATVTKWAQSIYPSHGWTNPALGTHASINSIGIPKRHLFQSILLR